MYVNELMFSQAMALSKKIEMVTKLQLKHEYYGSEKIHVPYSSSPFQPQEKVDRPSDFTQKINPERELKTSIMVARHGERAPGDYYDLLADGRQFPEPEGDKLLTDFGA